MQLPTPHDIELLAAQSGISIPEASRQAAIRPEWFTRWKAGRTTPTLRTLQRVIDVLTKGATNGDNQVECGN
jgi:predicted transcriptional regulator